MTTSKTSQVCAIIGIAIGSLTGLHVADADASEQSPVAGTWEVLDDGKPTGALMRIYVQDRKLVGVIVKTAPSIPKDATCAKCKEPLKGKPLIGLTIMWGFEEESGGSVWSGGVIVDPRSGDQYKSKVYIKSKDSIEVRGYVGIPLLGASQVWRRVPTAP